MMKSLYFPVSLFYGELWLLIDRIFYPKYKKNDDVINIFSFRAISDRYFKTKRLGLLIENNIHTQPKYVFK